MINFISIEIGGKWRLLVRKAMIFIEKHQNSFSSEMAKMQRRTSFHWMRAFYKC
jgi:hypothetical protein